MFKCQVEYLSQTVFVGSYEECKKLMVEIEKDSKRFAFVVEWKSKKLLPYHFQEVLAE